MFLGILFLTSYMATHFFMLIIAYRYLLLSSINYERKIIKDCQQDHPSNHRSYSSVRNYLDKQAGFLLCSSELNLIFIKKG